MFPKDKLFWKLVDLERRTSGLKLTGGECLLSRDDRKNYLLGYKWGWEDALREAKECQE